MNDARERDRRALHDLARMAAAPATPPEAPASSRPANPEQPQADHSGYVDLAKLMSLQPNWLDDALARTKAGERVAPLSTPPVEAPISAIAMMDDVTVPRSKMPIVVAALAALAMIGGGATFAWRVRSNMTAARTAAESAAVIANARASSAGPTLAIANAPSTGNALPAAEATPPAPASPTPNTTTSPTEPTTANAVADARESERHGGHPLRAARASHHGHASAAAADDDAPAPAPVAAAAPEPPAPRHTAKAKEKEPAPVDTSALGAALRAAVGPDATPTPPRAAAPAPAAAPAAAPKSDEAPAPKHAAASMEGRPNRPSPSAVMSALQAQLPSARSCVASAGGPSKVRVTFGSEGNVTSVDVSGAAQGDAKMSKCLQKALGKARVPAFADESYSAAVNVRPE
jgi:hypothetical protein